MKISAKEILEKLETKESNKIQASIYVSEETLDKFKKACGETPYSKVIEHLMELFISSASSETK